MLQIILQGSLHSEIYRSSFLRLSRPGQGVVCSGGEKPNDSAILLMPVSRLVKPGLMACSRHEETAASQVPGLPCELEPRLLEPSIGLVKEKLSTVIGHAIYS